MKLTRVVFVTAFLLPALFSGLSVLVAGDMSLELDNGITILLHEDQTWSYAPGEKGRLQSDMSLELDDGAMVSIRKDRAWLYLDKPTTPRTQEDKYLSAVYSKGTAQGPDLFDAKKMALEKASLFMAKQLYSAAGDETLSIEMLQKCIEEEDKKIDMQESVHGKVWQVAVTMSLESDQIRFMLDCARHRETP